LHFRSPFETPTNDAYKVWDAALWGVMQDHDFRVSLQDDFRRLRSSSIMMRREQERARLQDMKLKMRESPARWTDRIIVLALGGLGLAEVWIFVGLYPVNTFLANIFLCLLASLPLLWRRRAPVAVLFICVAVLGIQANFFNPTREPPLTSFVLLLVVFYSVAAHGGGLRVGVRGGFAFLAGIPAIDVPRFLAGENPGDIIPAWAFIIVFWFIGKTIRQRRLQAVELEDRASQLELEREEKARLAVAEERSRISRELHDVIAHSVSVMVVQAQAAQRLLEGEQREARQALGSVETTGRQALAEMRRLLGILRRTDAELALVPQPSLKHLDALVEQAREAGLPVELNVEGDAGSLPPGMDLTAYRIIQEALTNVRKHAGGAHTSVVVRRSDDRIELEITDDGPGTTKNDGTGQGLIGMRERVALYGGVLESGKREGDGYLVRARLPLDSERP
jgi:signal transduction histidine kinase